MFQIELNSISKTIFYDDHKLDYNCKIMDFKLTSFLMELIYLHLVRLTLFRDKFNDLYKFVFQDHSMLFNPLLIVL